MKEAKSKEDYRVGVDLFKEYAAQLGVDLGFQNFAAEVIGIEEQYSRPEGVLVIINDLRDLPMGCFGIRKFDEGVCELKRMYLREEARGQGMAKDMLLKSVQLAQELGYTSMRLDTLPTMQAAIALYQQFGFYEIAAYRYNPIPGTKYFEIQVAE